MTLKIDSFSHHAHSIKILSERNYEKYIDWILTNYMQLYVTKHGDNYYGIDYYYYGGKYPQFPNLQTIWITKKIFHVFFSSLSEIEKIEKIDEILEEGYYIEVPVNLFYDKKSKYYNMFNIRQSYLLFKSDFEENKYIFWGYNCKMKYTKQKIDKLELLELLGNSKYFELGLMSLERPLEYADTTLEFDKNLHICYVKDYLLGTNSFNKYKQDESYFGVKIYQFLQKEITENKNIDYRSVYLLLESKKIMSYRLNIMKEQYNLLDIDQLNILTTLLDELIKEVENLLIQLLVLNEYKNLDIELGGIVSNIMKKDISFMSMYLSILE